MKKTLAMMLLLAFLFGLTTALAETWLCPQCGEESDGNFCPYCGAKKPEKEVTCPGCGAMFGSDMGYSFCPNCGTALSGAGKVDIKAGDTLTFGHYDQDDYPDNGAEPIEWIVLENDGNTCTMLSKYGLDAVFYNTERMDVTWETCTLRKWLNSDFLNAAFTAEEQAMLQTVTVTADKNPESDADPGNDTQDKVFLLSIDEVNRYFTSEDNIPLCIPTETAMEGGISVMTDSFDNLTCWWWLRSPGVEPCYAADVYCLGIDCYGACVDNNGSVDGSGWYNGIGAMRPVVVLRLEDAESTYLRNDDARDGAGLKVPTLKTVLYSKGIDGLMAGDTLTFGHYDQDGNPDNGAEPIEWIVLDSDWGTCTLISKYGLDSKLYNNKKTGVTWETCSLRQWLNHEFLNAAFREKEQEWIDTVTVTADPNPNYATDPGNDTQDKVFLLSIDEVNRYFETDAAKVCMPTQTAMAVKNGASTNDAGACSWWLRSPGRNSQSAALVDNTNGSASVNDYGHRVDRVNVAVRPVVVLQYY